MSDHISSHQISTETDTVSALLCKPAGATHLLVLGHGAGAGMSHPFLDCLSGQLALHRIATWRYQFPYMEAGRRRPDHAKRLIQTVRAAVETARDLEPNLELLAGGKSMGGRMTSMAEADQPLGVSGLAFFGFPLHRPGEPSIERAGHLSRVETPMLFLQGDRDRLADIALLAPVCEQLGSRTRLHVVDGGDHSFAVLKRSGRSHDEIIAELATTTAHWTTSL